MKAGLPKRIFLAEEVPSLNKGEAAILLGLCKTLSDNVGEHELYLFSRSPKVDQQRYGPTVTVVGVKLDLPNSRWGRALRRLHIFAHCVQLVIWGCLCRLLRQAAHSLVDEGLWTTYANADLILCGHDNTLAGSTISPWHIGTLLFAKLAGKPIAVCAGSIGPFGTRLTVWLAKYLFARWDLITLRDSDSYEYCRKLGLANDRTYLTADVAFLLEPAPKEECERILVASGITRDRPIIGLTVVRGSRVFEYAFSASHPHLEGDAKEELHTQVIASLVEYLLERLHVFVVFVPHCIGPGLNDDRLVARKVSEKLRQNGGVWLLEEEYTPAQLKGLAGLFDLFIGERTHSVVNALSMRVPSIAISYPEDHRTYGTVGELLGQEQLLYDIRELDEASLCAVVERCWERRGQIRAALGDIMPKIEKKAQFNGALIGKLLEEGHERSQRL
jgi:colanic acid/amylovoran biosynthesis protein